MLKKLLVFLLPLLLSYSNGFGQSEKTDPVATEIKVGDQLEAMPQDPPSEQVNYVEESEMVRKMLQAKKAENAKTYDSYGGGITIIAMCIVLGALIVLSILFYIFGHISTWFISLKKKQTTQSLKKEDVSATEKDTPDSGEVIAAISAALAQHFATDHDMEDTILTIRRMRKSYSPWNSKIYNMRHQPEVIHHQKPGNR